MLQIRKQLKLSRPKVNMSIQRDSSLSLQNVRHSVGHLLPYNCRTPFYKNNVRYASEQEHSPWKDRKAFTRLSHLLSYDLDFGSLSHIYWLHWIPPELRREIKHVYSFTSQLYFKQGWSKLSKPFHFCPNLAIEMCLGWTFCYHKHNFWLLGNYTGNKTRSQTEE